MKTILLVEDDPFISDIYRQQFIKEGFNVSLATDGQMALEQLHHVAYDVVVLDILLPKIDGWEVLQKMRQDPTLKKVKVIIISNLDRQDFDDKISQLKVSKYFLKIESTPEEIAREIKQLTM